MLYSKEELEKMICGFFRRFCAFAAALGMLLSARAFAQNRKQTTSASTVTPACKACLAGFSLETMSFTGANADKCPKQVGNCFKANMSNKCDGAITDCLANNCAVPGSCSDEMSNRNLFGGCLQAVNQVMPYQCST
ncbi:MAG: hypothetical protein LBI17_01805, partial [Rickettsiales bacterium]|nr:hypothetical protein [Rickettsiales bacterium]